jgi:hypothetical protein
MSDKMASTVEDEEDVKRLFELVDGFLVKMLTKLLEKHKEGYRGWENSDNKVEFEKRLFNHALNGDMVDAANFAAFIWNIDRGEEE